MEFPKIVQADRLPSETIRSRKDFLNPLHFNGILLISFIKPQKAKVNRECKSIRIDSFPERVSLRVIDTQNHQIDVRWTRSVGGDRPNKYHSLPYWPTLSNSPFRVVQ
ncbi:hypothetical protein [Pseudomonas fragi]|uniref:hypothetical protein n=1 Tax=Pseudomonas fragi TaxID=296 RepID=UPI00147647B1|nr:hypothetical protein [Pseudomonas fragi]